MCVWVSFQRPAAAHPAADNNQLLAIMRSTAESEVPVWQVKYPNKASKEHQGNHKG